ncbi:hypothetical protein Ancab_039439 [Ancistrocladus abbreviatus]
MDDVDSVRITSEDSEVHGKGYSKGQSSPVNLSPASFPADIPIMGINGNHALIEEWATHDGLVAAYTSKPTVNRNRPVDGNRATHADCINEFDNVALSRGISKSRFTRHKSSSLRREKRSAVDIDSKSRPTQVADTVSNSHQPERMSLSSLHGLGPSNKLKGRFRHPVITMGRFKVGVKKKRKTQRKAVIVGVMRDQLAWERAKTIGKQVWAQHIVSVNRASPEVASWLSASFRRNLGCGNDTSFWFDAWSRRGQLANLFPRFFNLTADKGYMVKDQGFWQDSQWNWCPKWHRPIYERDNQRLQDFLAILKEETLQENANSLGTVQSGLTTSKVLLVTNGTWILTDEVKH